MQYRAHRNAGRTAALAAVLLCGVALVPPIAGAAGLDYALANVELNAEPLPPEDPLVAELAAVLAAGRAGPGESTEDAGYRQTDKIMELCAAHHATR